MSEKEREITTHRQAIASTLTALTEYDSKPFFLSLLTSVRLADIWKDNSQRIGLNSRLAEEIDALRETRKILNEEKDDRKIKNRSANGRHPLLVV